MVEVSDRGIKEEEIELDLGLSIGGRSFSRSEKLKFSQGETSEILRSNSSAVSTATLSEAESVVMDPQVKREIQALRRQEAKRKREEKKTRAQTGEPPAKKNGVHVNMNMSTGGQAEVHHYPVGPVQCTYAPVQFVPYSNGFAYPCTVPCWAPNGGGGGFRQFLASRDLVNNGEQNGKTTSLNNGSPICSSSATSGGSSDNTRSHSSRFNGSVGERNKTQSDHTATSHSAESNHNLVQPNEEPAPGNIGTVPTAKPISPKLECPPAPLKQVKVEPPKSKTDSTKTTHKTPSMPQMPYVSATGKGPNGKTVHGFLYGYSQSEISIVCVCHGSTFSPAEFVQHAGGTEVSQPLRHITVIPSAFGY